MDVFDHGSGETLATSIAAAYENKEPWFGYYFGPTAVLGKYAMNQYSKFEYIRELSGKPIHSIIHHSCSDLILQGGPGSGKSSSLKSCAIRLSKQIIADVHGRRWTDANLRGVAHPERRPRLLLCHRRLPDSLDRRCHLRGRLCALVGPAVDVPCGCHRRHRLRRADRTPVAETHLREGRRAAAARHLRRLHGASLPVGLGVSCSADRQIKARIDRDGIWLEALETEPAKYLPEADLDAMEPTRIDLDQPMASIRQTLTTLPISAPVLLTGTMGVSYLTVMLIALIPATLFFVSVFLAIHFEAKRQGLSGLPEDQIPRLWKVLRERGHQIIPLIVIVGTLFAGFSPAYAAFYGILSILPTTLLRKQTRSEFSLKLLLEGLENGVRNAVQVAMPICANVCKPKS